MPLRRYCMRYAACGMPLVFWPAAVSILLSGPTATMFLMPRALGYRHKMWEPTAMSSGGTLRRVLMAQCNEVWGACRTATSFRVPLQQVLRTTATSFRTRCNEFSGPTATSFRAPLQRVSGPTATSFRPHCNEFSDPLQRVFGPHCNEF